MWLGLDLDRVMLTSELQVLAFWGTGTSNETAGAQCVDVLLGLIAEVVWFLSFLRGTMERK